LTPAPEGRRQRAINPLSLAQHRLCKGLLHDASFSVRDALAQNDAEAEFLSLGEGARRWLHEAAEAGTNKVRSKMATAVALSKIHGVESIDWALGHCAVMGRFREGDLASVLAHHASALAGEPVSRSESHSLQPGTSRWADLGQDDIRHRPERTP
jgi:hypothetical protein